MNYEIEQYIMNKINNNKENKRKNGDTIIQNKLTEAESKNKIKTLHIEKYSGKPEEFDDYFREMSICAVSCNWKENEQIKILPLYLQGFALQCYKNIE